MKIIFLRIFFLPGDVSGMSEFAVDQRNVYNEIGHQKFIDLSTAFYDRVFADEEDKEFRFQFEASLKEDAIQNQYEFFIQRLGGPPLYTTRKSQDEYRGHPALRARHRYFKINTRSAERWLYHMKLAMKDVGLGNIEEEGSVDSALWYVY